MRKFFNWLPLLFGMGGMLFPLAITAQDTLKVLSDTLELAPASNTIFKSFYREDVLDMTLETDLEKLKKNKNTDKKQKAKITFADRNGMSNTHEIKIEPRGKYRRKICALPPIRLIFPKKKLDKRGFSTDFNKLKLVAPCLNSEESDQILLKEYWCYRLYNLLTDSSFRVQLVRLNFINKGKSDETEEKFAFIIENDDEMAYRLNGTIQKPFNSKPLEYDKEKYHIFLLFQYMIGNTDWSIKALRNIKRVEPVSDSVPFIVPYDFDFSGLVNAPYAVPRTDLKQGSIQQRVCMGTFSSQDDLEKCSRFFLSLKKQSTSDIKQSPYLNKKSKKEIIKYLKSFYRTIKNPNREEVIIPVLSEAEPR